MYLNFLLAEEDDRISAPDGNSGESACFNSLEGVLDLIESSLIAEDGDIVLAALPWLAHNLKTIQILFKRYCTHNLSLINIKRHLPSHSDAGKPPTSPRLFLS